MYASVNQYSLHAENHQGRILPDKRIFFIKILSLLVCCIVIGCRKEPAAESGHEIPEKIETPEVAVIFPKDLQQILDDEARQVVRQLIDACVQGDYDQFRLMWTISQDPYPRNAFEKGWKAVQEVQILNVVKRRRPAGDAPYEIVFGIAAHVALDPSIPEPERDIVLLLIPENNTWKIARPPGRFARELLGLPEDAPLEDAQTLDSESLPLSSIPDTQPAQ